MQLTHTCITEARKTIYEKGNINFLPIFIEQDAESKHP